MTKQKLFVIKIIFIDISQVLGIFSTYSSLIYLENRVDTGFLSGVYTDMILIDLTKTFDTINHILINKNKFIGFSEETNKSFKSCLSNSHAEFLKARIHFRTTSFSVVYKWDNVFKNEKSKICGRQPLANFTSSIPKYFVPNDMPQAVECKLMLYADGTCLIFEHKDIT